MRPGCPVGFTDLRLLTVTHWTFDGEVTTGGLVLHRDVAEAVSRVFGVLFEHRYPIRRMVPIDVFGAQPDAMDGADDFASIEADNTSAFNCRRRTASGDEYSEHSYGRAIDLNPIENPYVSRQGTTSHPASRKYLDRSPRPGVVTDGDVVVEAFASIGWSWGGHWTGIKDYQHFSSNGR